MTPARRAVAALAVGGIAICAGSGLAVAQKRLSPEAKCARYASDWREALRRTGTEELSAGFVAGNDAFVRAGCVRGKSVCPATPKDLRLADALAMRVVNAGMSTTFLPFDCPSGRPAP